MRTALPSPVRLLTLREDIRLEEARGELLVRHEWGTTRLGRLSPAVRSALEALAAGPRTEDELAELALAAPGGDESDLAGVLWAAARLRFLVVREVALEGRSLLTVTPTAPASSFAPGEPAPGAELRLSRFAFCRRLGDAMVLESPLALERVTLTDPGAAAVVAALARGRRTSDLREVAGLQLKATAILTLDERWLASIRASGCCAEFAPSQARRRPGQPRRGAGAGRPRSSHRLTSSVTASRQRPNRQP